MRLMLLMRVARGHWWPSPAFLAALRGQLVSTGELVSERLLSGTSGGLRVRARPGGPPLIEPVIPAEDATVLAACWVVDCDDLGRAITIAAQISAATGKGEAHAPLGIEVRPLMRGPGEEM